MSQRQHNNLKTFIIGFLIGGLLTIAAVGLKLSNKDDLGVLKFIKQQMSTGFRFPWSFKRVITEEFTQQMVPVSGQAFGRAKQLTFELYRDGTFYIDGDSKYALQKSPSYRDSAFIRSTEPLPKTYKISVIVGEINYGLDKIEKLQPDREYPEGPRNENGCYLIAITDIKPTGHHTNIWWHQHRKVVIDVDNNTWGHGMPNPMFMVYFDRNNTLVSYDGALDEWQRAWKKAVTYEPSKWYKIEVEKTKKHYIMRIADHNGKTLKQSRVPVKDVWHSGEHHPEYFVIGDPHENYYQGSMKIKSITITAGR